MTPQDRSALNLSVAAAHQTQILARCARGSASIHLPHRRCSVDCTRPCGAVNNVQCRMAPARGSKPAQAWT